MIHTSTQPMRNGRSCSQRAERGFTLVELMVTIVVAAVLMSIAVPSFRHLIRSTNMSSVSGDLLSTLKYARSEAVTRGRQVAVVESTSGSWSDGWNVVASAASAGGTPTVLRRYPEVGHDYQVFAAPAGATSVTFGPRGSMVGNGTCFTISGTATHQSEKPLYIATLPSGATRSTTTCASGNTP